MLNAEISQNVTELDSVVIRFAGDSGDGMQLTGNQFSDASASFGNDLATLPDYPAEIRAPIGTVGGVSAYQLQFSSRDIQTPGDELDVLVCMNAAALKKNIMDLKSGGYLFADVSGFDAKNLKLAGYEVNPLDTDLIKDYRVVTDDFTKLTINAVKELGLTSKNAKRCKNFFTLGVMFWLFGRDPKHTEDWLKAKFAKKPELADANITAMTAGYNYADTVEIFSESYQVKKAELPAGKYRKVSGNEATALGLLAASQQMGKGLFLGSYPITPASDILHNLSKYKNFGVKTFQAEDEIAAVCAAIGSSFAGSIGLTTTSGPGLCLKAEAMGLAVMTELPLVIVNVQRGGPSTGLPTKTEQSDLFLALYGRNGDSPMPVIAASSPADCFDAAMEATRLAVQFMTPVILLTDGYLGNGAEPWRIPAISDLPKYDFPTAAPREDDSEKFLAYARDPKTQARPWAIPGTKGLEHRIGGLEKESETGNISYDGVNHQKMTDERSSKVANIANFIPEQSVLGGSDDELLVISWGGTYGSVATAVENLREGGAKVAHTHIKYVNPLPKNFESMVKSYKKVLVCELNDGQMVQYINGQFSLNASSYTKVQGKPFKVSELTTVIREELEK